MDDDKVKTASVLIDRQNQHAVIILDHLDATLLIKLRSNANENR